MQLKKGGHLLKGLFAQLNDLTKYIILIQKDKKSIECRFRKKNVNDLKKTKMILLQNIKVCNFFRPSNILFSTLNDDFTLKIILLVENKNCQLAWYL
jgi:hypothetical protein